MLEKRKAPQARSEPLTLRIREGPMPGDRLANPAQGSPSGCTASTNHNIHRGWLLRATTPWHASSQALSNQHPPRSTNLLHAFRIWGLPPFQRGCHTSLSLAICDDYAAHTVLYCRRLRHHVIHDLSPHKAKSVKSPEDIEPSGGEQEDYRMSEP